MVVKNTQIYGFQIGGKWICKSNLQVDLHIADTPFPQDITHYPS